MASQLSKVVWSAGWRSFGEMGKWEEGGEIGRWEEGEGDGSRVGI